MSGLFLQAAQHFLELDIRRVHQLEYYKHAKKATEADVKRLDVEVSGFREALAFKEKELADLKNSHFAKLNSLKEQIANLQSAADALRVAKEEACKAAEDKSAEMERLKENHNSAIT